MNWNCNFRTWPWAGWLAAGAACLPAQAQQPAYTRLVRLPPPAVCGAAEPFNDRYAAVHLLAPAENAGPEYASKGLAEKTYVDFDFGRPVRLAAFRHVQRRTPDSIAAARLIFCDQPTFQTPLAQVDIRHVDEPGAATLATFAPVSARYLRWQVTSVLPGRSRNVGGRGVEFFEAGEIDAAPHGIGIEVKVVQIIERRGDQKLQPMRVILDYPYAEPLPVTVRLQGHPAREEVLRFGGQTLLYEITASESPARVARIALEAEGKEVAAQAIPLRPARQMTVYVLPHSHTDIGYTALQTDIEEKQVNNLLQGMAEARRTADYPAGARFVWNVEVLWAADLFLRRCSASQREEFFQAVKQGRVALNGLYLNELTGLCRPEELVRLFRYATRLGGQCGMPVDAAMISDVPGYTWGTVTAMAQSGIRYFSVAPNYFDRIGDILVQWENRPFWWVGPDGRSQVLVWIPFWGYAMSHRYREFTPGLVQDFCDGLESRNYPFEIAYVRWAGRGDNAVPDPAICDFVKDWNATHDSPRFVISSTSKAFQAFEARYGGELPRVKGDWTPYWEDGAGSSAAETALNRASSSRLAQAETLWALLDPGSYPASRFEDAWNDVLLYSEHTWGAFCSISEPASPFTAEQWTIKQSYATSGNLRSRQLLAEAAQRGGGFQPVPADALEEGLEKESLVDVYNTSSWMRSGLALVPRELSAAGDFVSDEQGRPVSSQRLASRELALLVQDLPPFSGRRYRIAKTGTNPPASAALRASPDRLENEHLRVQVDAVSGAITGLYLHGLEPNLVDTSGGEGINDYLYFLGDDLTRVQRAGPATLTVRDRGPLVVSLLAESDAPGCHRLRREVRLVAGSDCVELLDAVDKKRLEAKSYFEKAGKESLNFAFPLHVPGGELRIEAPLSIFRPEQDQMPGACKNWLSVGGWADVANRDFGITWVTLDAPLLQLGGLSANLLNSQTDPDAWRKQIEPTGKLYAWAMNNHWGTNYRAYQEGPVAFRFVLRPHRGSNPAEASRLALQYSQPLVAVPGRGPAPRGRPRVQVSSSPDGLVVTCLKPGDDGKSLILRLFGAAGQSLRARLEWEQPAPLRLWLSDTGERPLSEVPMPGEIEVPAQGLVTLRADLAEEAAGASAPE